MNTLSLCDFILQIVAKKGTLVLSIFTKSTIENGDDELEQTCEFCGLPLEDGKPCNCPQALEYRLQQNLPTAEDTADNTNPDWEESQEAFSNISSYLQNHYQEQPDGELYEWDTPTPEPILFVLEDDSPLIPPLEDDLILEEIPPLSFPEEEHLENNLLDESIDLAPLQIQEETPPVQTPIPRQEEVSPTRSHASKSNSSFLKTVEDFLSIDNKYSKKIHSVPIVVSIVSVVFQAILVGLYGMMFYTQIISKTLTNGAFWIPVGVSLIGWIVLLIAFLLFSMAFQSKLSVQNIITAIGLNAVIYSVGTLLLLLITATLKLSNSFGLFFFCFIPCLSMICSMGLNSWLFQHKFLHRWTGILSVGISSALQNAVMLSIFLTSFFSLII